MWDGASLRTQTSRVMLMQFVDAAAVKLKGTWDSASLRKETLRNRKEARF
jgi:hypothetical protein